MTEEIAGDSELQVLVRDILGFIDYKLNVHADKKSYLTENLTPLQLIGALSTNIIVNMTACALLECSPRKAKEDIMTELMEKITQSVKEGWRLYCIPREQNGVN
jgi:hypothetical protein